MLDPGLEMDIMNRHRELLRGAATHRKHFGAPRPNRARVALLAFVARIARGVADRFEATVESLNGCEDTAVRTTATSCRLV